MTDSRIAKVAEIETREAASAISADGASLFGSGASTARRVEELHEPGRVVGALWYRSLYCKPSPDPSS